MSRTITRHRSFVCLAKRYSPPPAHPPPPDDFRRVERPLPFLLLLLLPRRLPPPPPPQVVITNFVPPEEVSSVERRAQWNEEASAWLIPRLELAGNSLQRMRRPVSAVGLPRPETEYARHRKGYDSNPRCVRGLVDRGVRGVLLGIGITRDAMFTRKFRSKRHASLQQSRDAARLSCRIFARTTDRPDARCTKRQAPGRVAGTAVSCCTLLRVRALLAWC